MEVRGPADWFCNGMRTGIASSGIKWLPNGWHYAWVIVAVIFAVAVMTAGVRSTPGVLIVPLEGEFHWSRATISFALGVNLLLFGAIGPFAAALMDRFGARRTITLALATAAASVLLTPAMNQPWQLVLLWGVAVGLSTGFVGGFLAAYIAGRYFECGPTTNALIANHLVPACLDHGLREIAEAVLLPGTGVFALLGGTLSACLSDRCDNRLLLCAYYRLRGLSLLYLPFAF